MAVVALRQSRQRTRRTEARSRHPKLYLADDTGLKVELPYAPREADLGGIAPAWDTLPRAKRLPLLLNAAPQLHALSFDVLIVGDPVDHQASAEALLYLLRVMANRGARVTLGNLGPSERIGNGWRIVDCQQRGILRQDGTNHLTRAVVSLSFLEASDAVVAVGPLTGGAKPPPAVAPAPGSTTTAPARTYTVKAGDTLYGIALRHYGDGNAWRALADANGITDPRTLAVGKVLRIPDRPA